jgi:hypothetical protein
MRRYQLQFGAWLALALSIGIYVALSTRLHQPFHVGLRRLSFFDLRCTASRSSVISGSPTRRSPRSCWHR